jgi:hypothetical protein
MTRVARISVSPVKGFRLGGHAQPLGARAGDSFVAVA